MSWQETKKSCRALIHQGFSWSAFYSDEDRLNVPCSVRHHRKSQYIGEDYQDFSPGAFAELNRVIVDTDEIKPRRGGKIRIEGETNPDGSDLVLQIENFEDQGQQYLLCEVRLDSSDNL